LNASSSRTSTATELKFCMPSGQSSYNPPKNLEVGHGQGQVTP